MNKLIRLAVCTVALCTIASCKSVSSEPSGPLASTKATTCDHLNSCQNGKLLKLVQTAQDQANRGRTYLKTLSSSKNNAFQHLSRIQKLIDLDYSRQFVHAASLQKTNPDLVATDFSRLSSYSAKGEASGAGLLALLNSATAQNSLTDTSFLSILVQSGSVSVNPQGLLTLSNAELTGVVGETAYLWWDVQTIYKTAHTKSRLEKYIAEEATYIKTVTPFLNGMSLSEKRELVQAFDGLLKEIRMDYDEDFPKSGPAHGFIAKFKKELGS